MKPTNLELIVDEGIFLAYAKTQPALVEAVRDAVALGQTPAQIEHKMARRFGKTEIVQHIRSIAEHIHRDHAGAG